MDAEGGLLADLLSEKKLEELDKWMKENKIEKSFLFEKRLEEGDRLRTEGNELFKKEEFEGALRNYYVAIYMLDFDMKQWGDAAGPYQEKLDTRKVKIISNICQIKLKQKDYVGLKETCEVGFRHLAETGLDDKEAEARYHYLKGKANVERGFSEEAVESLKKAQALLPNDAQVRQLLQQAGQMKKEDRKQAKEVWKSKLLTAEEKACMGPIWHPACLLVRAKVYCRRRCCPRKPEGKGL
eukprot:TRINITY_DN19352_c0_g1_i1.p2 TRINITY_DN19352_c0_g1~~TRINITY_DN19352_c0_g1_i1.p2  ORF type:complete len:240 (-),score=77.02 TRINITY_DN19352_c0_g1_i1:149-868(-)